MTSMKVLVKAIADAARIKECIILDGRHVPYLSFEFAIRYVEEDGSTFIRYQRFLIQNLCDLKYASAGSIWFTYDWNVDEIPNWNTAKCHWIYGELIFEKVRETKVTRK